MADDISKQIMDSLTQYTDEIRKQTKKIIQQESRKCAKKLREISPEATIKEEKGKRYYILRKGKKKIANKHLPSGKYKKAWVASLDEETNLSSVYVVHNKKGTLAHLLEYGHANRDGSRTEKYEHIKKAEEETIKAIERRIDDLL